MGLAYGLDPNGEPEAVYFKGSNPRDMVVLGPCHADGPAPADWRLSAQARKRLAQLEPGHPLVSSGSGPAVVTKGGTPYTVTKSARRQPTVPSVNVLPDEMTSIIVCPVCGGSGECDGCDGAGEVNGTVCDVCDGTGECQPCGGQGAADVREQSAGGDDAARARAQGALRDARAGQAKMRSAARSLFGGQP
jgi:hypothetical protein